LYHPNDLTIGDVADFLRRNQEMYFRSGSFSAVEAATHIAIEAMICGAKDVRISLDGDWIIIYANVDWLEGTTDDVFLQLEHFPQDGPNSHRSEVILHTFCSRLIVATLMEVTVIKGGSEDLPRFPVGDWVRAMAFTV
jgi:hypothetical protein